MAITVTIRTWDQIRNNVPRDFGGTAQHADVWWEWNASANRDGASAYWVAPVGGYRDQDHEESLEDASSEVFHAVGRHVSDVVDLILRREEAAAHAVLDHVTNKTVEIVEYL